MDPFATIPSQIAAMLRIHLELGLRTGAALLQAPGRPHADLNDRAILHDSFRAASMFLDIVKLDKRRNKQGLTPILNAAEAEAIDLRMMDFSQMSLMLEWNNDPVLIELQQRLLQRLQHRLRRKHEAASTELQRDDDPYDDLEDELADETPHTPAKLRETAPKIPTPDDGYEKLAERNGVVERLTELANDRIAAEDKAKLAPAPAPEPEPEPYEKPTAPDQVQVMPQFRQAAARFLQQFIAWHNACAQGPPPDVPAALRREVARDPAGNPIFTRLLKDTDKLR